MAEKKPDGHLGKQYIGRYSRQLLLPEIGVKGKIPCTKTAILLFKV